MYDFNIVTPLRAGQIVTGRISVIRGGAPCPEDPSDMCATASVSSESKYIKCFLTVLAGEAKGERVPFKIGLYSPKGDTWAAMGRRLVKDIIECARNIDRGDTSEAAQNARRIQSYLDLHDMIICGKIQIENGAPCLGSVMSYKYKEAISNAEPECIVDEIPF